MAATSLRIFIASPSDVTPERQTARRVIQRLGREYADHFSIASVLWEREPLAATESPQEGIPKPSETDIVVVVMWSRLGTPLSGDEWLGPLSNKPVTGTEWEFENAVQASQKHGKPHVMFYLRNKDILINYDNSEQQTSQKKLVDEFVKTWFIDTTDNTLKAAYHTFTESAEFERMLEQHLRELLKRRLPQGTEKISCYPGSPFRGLRSFELEHAPIFYGRTQARHELRDVLKVRAALNCAFVLVYGASGSGKSSLVKAGLLSDLLLPGMMERVAVCRNVVVTPTSLGSDLVQGLADALLKDKTHQKGNDNSSHWDQALPEMCQDALDWDSASLAKQLRGEQAWIPIQQGLKVAGDAAKLTEYGVARLLIIVDQFEEIFTQGRITEEGRSEFVGVLDRLARSGVVWVVCVMRSDFIHWLEKMPQLMALTPSDARYSLKPTNLHDLEDIVRRPAQMVGLQFEKDATKGIGLDDVIVQASLTNPGILPLLQFLLDLLWHKKTPERLLTFASYHDLGKLEGAIGRRAEEIFRRLGKEEQASFASIMRLLVTVGDGDGGKATARSVSLSQFGEGTPRRRLVDALLSERLLVADGDTQGAQVRVVHEALLTHWPEAAKQIQQDYVDLQLRGRLEQAAARWNLAGKKDKRDLLLPGGFQLQEGRELLKRWSSEELGPEILAYVKASISSFRRRRMRLILVIVLSVLTLPVGYGMWWGVRTYLGVLEVEKAMAFVSIPKGCYQMGSPETEPGRSDDEAQHKVCIENFELGQFEVMQSEWEQVMHSNPSRFKNEKNPVEMVSWDESVDFAKYMSWFGKCAYRLPTEAEWEYAARGGTTTSRYWGDGKKEACQFANVLDLDAKAGINVEIGSWFECHDGIVPTALVGYFKPNGFGLYDILGNVWEWTCSAYASDYDGSEKNCAKTEDKGSNRVSRGGSWDYGPAYVRSAYRGYNAPGGRGNSLGFRLARTCP
ncbi:MAG: SUMF1/EgtB/PvdO family nonheme iron enzyme [Nitrospirae bacterium]|nr:SUMF1/EgtB/PvdO family nonheme iron enzyme [Magnetococcales bacterium]